MWPIHSEYSFFFSVIKFYFFRFSYIHSVMASCRLSFYCHSNPWPDVTLHNNDCYKFHTVRYTDLYFNTNLINFKSIAQTHLQLCNVQEITDLQNRVTRCKCMTPIGFTFLEIFKSLADAHVKPQVMRHFLIPKLCSASGFVLTTPLYF